MASEPTTKVQVKVLTTNDPSLPSLVLQVTQMVDTYMVWVGTASNNTDIGNGEKVVLSGNLCRDWACAMPPRGQGAPSAATTLFRSSAWDVALPMAQRLAKRFGKQIFLSVDIGQEVLVVEAEKGIVAALKEIAIS